jgi:adenylyl-sulfate kinase
MQSTQRPNLFQQIGKISRSDRERLNGNKAFTLWLTGLSGAGKSTLAIEVESWIYNLHGHVYILDGDNTRLGLNKDLSFTDDDRTENIRRVAELCKLFNDAGIIVIASFISPFLKDRLMARSLIGAETFSEIYIDADLETCKLRDTKGLYKLASEGKIKNFTGIDSLYELPLTPDLHIQTHVYTIPECLDQIKDYLHKASLFIKERK